MTIKSNRVFYVNYGWRSKRSHKSWFIEWHSSTDVYEIHFSLLTTLVISFTASPRLCWHCHRKVQLRFSPSFSKNKINSHTTVRSINRKLEENQTSEQSFNLTKSICTVQNWLHSILVVPNWIQFLVMRIYIWCTKISFAFDFNIPLPVFDSAATHK